MARISMLKAVKAWPFNYSSYVLNTVITLYYVFLLLEEMQITQSYLV